VFAEIFDGLRAFYSRKEGAASSPAFSAAMLLSFLFSVNLCTIAALLQALIYGHVTVGSWGVEHKGLVLVAGFLIAWGHITLSKRIGLYYRRGPVISTTWARPFVAYCILTVVLFIACMATTYLTRTV
jgi:hypothetical protein